MGLLEETLELLDNLGYGISSTVGGKSVRLTSASAKRLAKGLADALRKVLLELLDVVLRQVEGSWCL